MCQAEGTAGAQARNQGENVENVERAIQNLITEQLPLTFRLLNSRLSPSMFVCLFYRLLFFRAILAIHTPHTHSLSHTALWLHALQWYICYNQ